VIVMTATVKPRSSVQVLHLLEQCLRRHFRSIQLLDDSLIIQVPDVGRVLVTEQLAMMRLDFLVNDPTAATAAMAALEKHVHTQVRNQGLSISWDSPGTVPTALR
jgi:predicted ATP-grasp superfamily ATP-dependent carboligase